MAYGSAGDGLRLASLTKRPVFMTTPPVTRPASDEYAQFYANYVSLVPDGDILKALARQKAATAKLLGGIGARKAGYRYAPEKWSIKGVVGHVVDAERVFAYRALSIGRGDPAPLPGFDEKAWAGTSNFDDRPFTDLVNEYQLVRETTLALLRGLPAQAWARRGTASNYPVTVRALAWIIAGHELHHIRVLKDRYL